MEFDKTLLAGSTGMMVLKLLERSIPCCTRSSRKASSPRGMRRPPRAAPGDITT